MEPDFTGYATKVGLKCSDGRTIMPDAFKHMDGKKVPLVWQHGYQDSSNILGHAFLEHRPDGVYARAYFNDTPSGQNAKKLVQHGDVNSLSIYANKLLEKAKQVYHGIIHEVSLVLSGANPGALIDNVSLRHGDDIQVLDDEAIIYTGLELRHSDDAVKTPSKSSRKQEAAIKTKKNTKTAPVAKKASTGPKNKTNKIKHADSSNVETDTPKAKEQETPMADTAELTVADVYNSFTEEQKNVVHFMIGAALEERDDELNDAKEEVEAAHSVLKHFYDDEGNLMVHNIFENDGAGSPSGGASLTHDQLADIVGDAKRMGSFKDSFLSHAESYGITDIDVLFPDAKAVTDGPELVKSRTEWVNAVLGGVKKSPFSKIKSLSADLTYDTARAKGYIKGGLKRDQFFGVAKRTTSPTTVYKKNKLDRDDVLDITDLDIVTWLKGEMRVMLDEEIARAILIGDGRDGADVDKIDESHIRPIATDNDFYTTAVQLPANASGDGLVEQILRARKHYRGSGTPTFYTSEDVLTDLLLIKDKMGRRLYGTEAELKSALRVADIVTVEAMEGYSHTTRGGLWGILVNVADYTVGADRGGQVSMFDDFDIDYNQQKYLIEARTCGALIKPKAAVAIWRQSGTKATPVAPTFDGLTNTITIPSVTGLSYFVNGDLTSGTFTVTSANSPASVTVTPNDDFYIAPGTQVSWEFEWVDN